MRPQVAAMLAFHCRILQVVEKTDLSECYSFDSCVAGALYFLSVLGVSDVTSDKFRRRTKTKSSYGGLRLRYLLVLWHLFKLL